MISIPFALLASFLSSHTTPLPLLSNLGYTVQILIYTNANKSVIPLLFHLSIWKKPNTIIIHLSTFSASLPGLLHPAPQEKLA